MASDGDGGRGLSTVRLADKKTQPQIRRFKLSVTAGPDKGKEFVSEGDRAVIGSDPSSQLVLTDRTCSRLHCEITVSAGKAFLRDLGSRNETLINGVPVERARLIEGAVIALGRTQVRFGLAKESITIPLSTEARFGSLVGRSSVMRAVFAMLEQSARSDTTILLEGPTGTGKEAAAESIHMASPRRDGPFIVLDCGALPPDLLESELFGHEKGAFTGAVSEREGAFEAAHGGTIFLDEIGELALDLQPKLLRVLEQRQVKRVGTSRYNDVDVRVIAATNRDLRVEVNNQRFRADLYYRLAVVSVRLPPLRERLEDLPLLVEQLLGDGPVPSELREPSFLEELSRHSWPGNVRELRNYLERCVALRSADPPAPEEPERAEAGGTATGPAVDAKLPLREAREAWTNTFEKRYLVALLALHQDNVSAAARAAGIARIHLHRLLRKHGLR
jgi:transcriptional regulator with GAF, ATPase, and Fis domain